MIVRKFLACAALAIAMPGAVIWAQPAAPTADQANTDSRIVYFSFEMSELAPGASEVLDDLLVRLKARAYAAILVEGHVDNGTPAATAMPLSRAMAESVRAYLVKGGADFGRIRVLAHGATQLARATGPNVREPLNRRVTITVTWR